MDTNARLAVLALIFLFGELRWAGTIGFQPTPRSPCSEEIWSGEVQPAAVLTA